MGCVPCKKKKTTTTEERVLDKNWTDQEVIDTYTSMVSKVKHSTDEIQSYFELFNRIYENKQTNYSCGACQKTVFRGIENKYYELTGKTRVKR